MAGRFAADTDVSVDKSKAELESILRRYGADQYATGWDRDKAMVQFRADDRFVRFVLTLPDRNDDEFTMTPARKYARTAAQADAAWEQACRQRWRALALVVKAKLEAVECGITTFEEEFMAHILLPDGTTVAEHIGADIAAAYATGQMPASLLALPAPRKGRS